MYLLLVFLGTIYRIEKYKIIFFLTFFIIEKIVFFSYWEKLKNVELSGCCTKSFN